MKQLRKTDGGIVSILIVVLLLAVTLGLYLQIVLTTAGAGLLLLAFSKPIRKMIGKVH